MCRTAAATVSQWWLTRGVVGKGLEWRCLVAGEVRGGCVGGVLEVSSCYVRVMGRESCDVMRLRVGGGDRLDRIPPRQRKFYPFQ